MSQSVNIITCTKDEVYSHLIPVVKNLINKDDHLVSNLSNLTAVLKQSLQYVSWVGFYLFDGNESLYLGPFQGKVACTKIKIGEGVCRTSAKLNKTIIVPDVQKFEGHIACDADSKSEIVIPLFNDKKLYGVLDLDSSELNSFDEEDKLGLEIICEYLVKEIFEGN